MGNLQGPPEQDWDQMDIEEILRLAYEENTDDLERRDRMERKERNGRHEQSRYVRDYSSSRYVNPYGNKSPRQVFGEAFLCGVGNVLLCRAGNAISNWTLNRHIARQRTVYIIPQEQIQGPQVALPNEDVSATSSRRECDHPFLVEQHLMTLPGGRKASPEKVAMAVEAGFGTLPEGKTWVKTYMKGEKNDV